ncbi:MAG: hypothetical protein JXR96_15860, partial [Deltaproteobacteria bacterium]|nr:hypothetical protein [Deltaproteobacteria bacterium]
MRACYPAGLLLLGLWAWGCSGCEDVDGGYKPPSHQGFDEVDRYGAVRVGYLEDPNLGFDFNGKYI